MRIGELARTSGTPIETIRFYEREGLLPTPARSERPGNFKPSPDTEAAIREVMLAAGVTPPAEIVAKTQQIY